MRLGSNSRNRMRVLPAPRLRAASTYSFSRNDNVCPRMMRPMYGQLKKPMITTSMRTRVLSDDRNQNL